MNLLITSQEADKLEAKAGLLFAWVHILIPLLTSLLSLPESRFPPLQMDLTLHLLIHGYHMILPKTHKSSNRYMRDKGPQHM